MPLASRLKVRLEVQLNTLLLPPQWGRIGSAGSEDIAASLSDDEAVLKLSTTRAIGRDRSPAVGPRDFPEPSLVDHGLNCERVSHLHSQLMVYMQQQQNCCTKARKARTTGAEDGASPTLWRPFTQGGQGKAAPA